MKNEALIEIPLKPLSINEAWQGRRFKTRKYKNYCEDVSLLLPKIKTIKGEVYISYIFYLHNWRRTDIDNLIKPLQDILVANHIIEDDRKVICISAEKRPKIDNNGYEEIKIYIHQFDRKPKTIEVVG